MSCLQAIKSDYGDVGECLAALLDMWLSRACKPDHLGLLDDNALKSLLDALQSCTISRDDVADKLKKIVDSKVCKCSR